MTQQNQLVSTKIKPKKKKPNVLMIEENMLEKIVCIKFGPVSNDSGLANSKRKAENVEHTSKTKLFILFYSNDKFL